MGPPRIRQLIPSSPHADRDSQPRHRKPSVLRDVPSGNVCELCGSKGTVHRHTGFDYCTSGTNANLIA